MTKEEAIEQLKDLIKDREALDNDDDVWRRDIEALHHAINALTSQLTLQEDGKDI